MRRESEVLDRDPSQEDENDLTVTSVGTAVLGSSDWTVETILNQLRKGNIGLTAKFQRREAWTDQRKSRFIESLILGLPIPQLVFAESRDSRGTYLVIDGKQRLLALRRFAGLEDNADNDGGDEADEPLRLNGLTVRTELNGRTFQDILQDPELAEDVRNFENHTMRSVFCAAGPTKHTSTPSFTA